MFNRLFVTGTQSKGTIDQLLIKRTKLADDKVLASDLIDTCSKYLEHPELIAQRLDTLETDSS